MSSVVGSLNPLLRRKNQCNCVFLKKTSSNDRKVSSFSQFMCFMIHLCKKPTQLSFKQTGDQIKLPGNSKPTIIFSILPHFLLCTTIFTVWRQVMHAYKSCCPGQRFKPAQMSLKARCSKQETPWMPFLLWEIWGEARKEVWTDPIHRPPSPLLWN